MRKLLAIALLTALSAGLVTAQEKEKKKKGSEPVIELKTKLDTISYALGGDIGKNLKMNGIDFTMDPFIAGIRDAVINNTNRFTPAQTDSIMNVFQQELMAKQESEKSMKSKENKDKGLAFLAENKTKEGVIETASGLQYKVLVPGMGENPKATDEVTVHYTGTLIDGTVFDSSLKGGKPVTFPLNGVIPGWTEGLQFVKPGGKLMLWIKSDLAYGDREVGPIPAGSLLIFEIELLSINAPSETK